MYIANSSMTLRWWILLVRCVAEVEGSELIDVSGVQMVLVMKVDSVRCQTSLLG